MNKTYLTKTTNKLEWFFIDAKNQTLGRLCTKIASTLNNKSNILFTPYQKHPYKIIVINAEYIKVSGQKIYQKYYYKHSGKPGGLKKESFFRLQQRMPSKIIEQAVKGMLPKNALGRKLFTNLKVYPGPNHPHNAQNPIPLKIK